MATNQTIQPTEIIHKLADLLRANAHRVQHGDSKVCFTLDSLNLINNYFQWAKLNVKSSPSRERSQIFTATNLSPITTLRMSTKMREDLVFLQDFVQKIRLVKIINHSATIQSAVQLDPFRSLVSLELKKIGPQMINGLSAMQDRLETLICSHSITNIQDLIIGSADDLGQTFQWPRLKYLFLSHNFIEFLDRSLSKLTALEVLDLSHNRIRDCSKILDIVPRLKHLNLSSNQLRSIPIWYTDNGECSLITLKLRQNRIETIRGIESMKSIEELDLSDNFLTEIPPQIRQMMSIKRLFFGRNPCTYSKNYRRDAIKNLPYPYNREDEEFVLDDRPLTRKEKKTIPKANFSSRPLSVRFNQTPISSPAASSTSSGSTTETESTSQTSTNSIPVVLRRNRSRSKEPSKRKTQTALTSSDSDATPSSDSKTLDRIEEVRSDPNRRQNVTSKNSDGSELGEDGDSSWHATAIGGASGVPKKAFDEFSKSPNRHRSPRNSKTNNFSSKITIEVVNRPDPISENSSIESTTPIERNSVPKTVTSPLTTLKTETFLNEDDLFDGNLRTIFFVKALTSDGESSFSFTVELDPIHLIEKDFQRAGSIEKIKYSNIENFPSSNRSKTVEFTFKRMKNEIVQRVYLFDTVQDQKSFADEMNRHLGISASANFSTVEKVEPKNFEKKVSTSEPESTTTETKSGEKTKISVVESSEEENLDSRLYFLAATEHFFGNDEELLFHFQCLTVRSSNGRHFLAQTILTNRGIYIYQKEPPNDEVFLEFLLAGQDLLTNVLMVDIGFQLQTLTIELRSGAFAFLPGSQERTQKIFQKFLEILQPVIVSGQGALQKISRISSDEYRQRLYEIIRRECQIEPNNDEIIEFYSIMIRYNRDGTNQIIALLLIGNWILIIEDVYEQIEKRHVRLPSMEKNENQSNSPVKCEILHLVAVVHFTNQPTIFQIDFVDESETIQFNWRLETLDRRSKEEFFDKLRRTYRDSMSIELNETNAIF